jgi:hypothetical protein
MRGLVVAGCIAQIFLLTEVSLLDDIDHQHSDFHEHILSVRGSRLLFLRFLQLETVKVSESDSWMSLAVRNAKR